MTTDVVFSLYDGCFAEIAVCGGEGLMMTWCLLFVVVTLFVGLEDTLDYMFLDGWILC